MSEEMLLENHMMNRGRVRYWDIVKEIAIIVMILGHTSGIPSFVCALIFSFHMPIFYSRCSFYYQE